MSRANFIQYYVPCSEAQKTKIEDIRNMRRLKAWEDKKVLRSIGIGAECLEIGAQH